ncbi:MAG: hypothetical protein GX764_07125 [Firmicutes bacterium]|nr:hypothetical protein [Bacillota bacterium]
MLKKFLAIVLTAVVISITLFVQDTSLAYTENVLVLTVGEIEGGDYENFNNIPEAVAKAQEKLEGQEVEKVEILVADGRYELSKSLAIPPGVYLKRADNDVLPEIVGKDNFSTLVFENIPQDSGTGIEGFKITFDNNYGFPVEKGGGVYVHKASPVIKDCEVVNNRAYKGGGIYIEDGSPHIENVIISGNSLVINLDSNGGGVYVTGEASAPLFIKCKISDNIAQESGGAVYIEKSEAIFKNCQMQGNKAGKEGGAIYAGEWSTLRLESSLLQGNVANGTGGGIYSDNAELFLDNSKVNANKAGRGGALFLLDSKVAVFSGEIKENTANFGGAIYSGESSLSFKDADISGNKANNGGGVYFTKNFDFDLEHSSINHNSAISNGGGIYADTASGSIRLSKVEFCQNKADCGGGIFIQGEDGAVEPSDTELLIDRCCFLDNKAGREGGGIYLQGVPLLKLTRTFVYGNEAGDRGGAIYLYSCAEASMQGVHFQDNKAGNYGGALQSIGSSIQLQNSLFVGNRAEQYSGGAIRSYEDSSLQIVNCTIAENSSGSIGDGIYFRCDDLKTLQIISSIVCNEIKKSNESSAEAYALYTCLKNTDDDFAGEGNIFDNPQFIDPLNGNWQLNEGSPCIDQGILMEEDGHLGRDAFRPPGLGGEQADMGAFGGPGNVIWLASEPTAPSPSDGVEGLSLEVQLSWEAEGADSYDLYLWESGGDQQEPLLIKEKLGENCFLLSELSEGKTYCWQVIARNKYGARPGPLWCFKTLTTPDTGFSPGGKRSRGQPKEVIRIAGNDRYETAVMNCRLAFRKSESVVVVPANNFSVAMAGVALAKALESPLLYAYEGVLPEITAAELERLGVKKVYLLENSDPYDIAPLVAEHFGSADNAVLVRGDDYADILAAASCAAMTKAPLLFVRPGELPSPTEKALRHLGVKRVTIIGGEAAVSSIVEEELVRQNIQVFRLGGKDRYETAIKVAEKHDSFNGSVFIARGDHFADAFSLAAAASQKSALNLLTNPTALPFSVKQYIAKIAPLVNKVYFCGGEGAITEKAKEELRAVIK